jgi:HPt (histidine-containing phosphotransfer) domain-containing protein
MKLSPAEIEARLAEVRRSYLASLRDKRDAIETQWSRLCTQWDTETYQSLYLIIHTLAGSAETFGLVNISRQARKLADQFKQNADQHPLDPHLITAFTSNIELLLASMTAALAELDNQD